ncbi:DUF4181 domain-containing protein [Sutcliffiella deserti]|uniref:DUF4181 domain-containing protein n=1 Tax=Sutcliffiella deserti TaxID=2875501 RepID=UPI001CBA9765|nr:DUF4181 domain-containing protein [Sutcliffiella deserti]
MFWFKLAMLFLIIFILVSLVQFTVRKLFQIEKRKSSFTYNHVNKKHKKLDWAVRLIFMFILIYSFYLYLNDDLSINFYFLALIFYMVFSELIRAYFEWKHSPSPKQAILTLSEAILLLAITGVFVGFDLLSVIFG